MSHPIYYNSIVHEALYLEQLSSASQAYVSMLLKSFSSEKNEKYPISEFEIEYANYKEWLIEIVSQATIGHPPIERLQYKGFSY